MKTIIVLIALLALAGIAEAQKTCKNAQTLQACTVTVTVTLPTTDATHGPATSVQVRRADGTGAMNVISTLTPPTLSMQDIFTDAGGVNHCYDATAFDAKGNPSQISPQSCWASPAIIQGPPNTPSAPTLSQIQRDRITITWGDQSEDEDGFAVVRMQANMVDVIQVAEANQTSITDTELKPATAYRYQVAAFNQFGYSLPSRQVTARTPR